MREVKFSKAARYSRDFSPPTSQTTDSETLALYRCDEGQGDELKDSSGHNHHGKIVGAKWVIASEVPTAPVTPPDYALSFNGTDASVEIPSLTYDGTHPLTIEARVRMEGTSPADSGVIAGWQGLISLASYK